MQKIKNWIQTPTQSKLIQSWFHTLIPGTTIITITLIAWNRYKLVVNPQGYHETFSTFNMGIMLAVAWALPMVCLIPALMEVWGRFGYVTMLVTCNLLLDHDSQSFKVNIHASCYIWSKSLQEVSWFGFDPQS